MAPDARWIALALGLAVAGAAGAQELEPRALQNAPVGLNFLVASVGYARGNLLMDPSLPIENARADVGTLLLGLFRTIGLLGMNGRIGVAVPLATGEWSGQVAGADTSTTRTGAGDPRFMFALNFIGAPALSFRDFRGYRQHTVVGMQFAIGIPIGQYYPERLVNLGSNRWSFMPRFGVSQLLGRWVFEAYSGVVFYTRNDAYYGGKVLTQDPFFDVQGHVIYALRYPSFWTAASVGYGWGGVAGLNGVPKQPLHNVRASAMVRVPLGLQHALKLVYINGLHTKFGTDFDTFQVVYQYAFGAPKPPRPAQ
ncbi:MAG TPA: transporter [Gemmatimonadales bacterium]|nr:transporter [Gemmatimonadales bacterium]